MPFFGVPIRNGLPIGLGSVAGFGVQQFDPSQLFEGGTVAGAWYDPSDLSTMFDTSAGTTPVAMPGQGSAVSVGLMLDKSQGLVLGPELITPADNRDFSSDTGYWSKSGGCTISAGACNYSSVANTNGLFKIGAVSANTYYEVQFTIVSVSAGGLQVYLGGRRGPSVTSAGTYTQRILSGNLDTYIVFEAVGTSTLVLDNVSLKTVSGNHAIAFNDTTARPELRARVNLLTYSEQFDNGDWLKYAVAVSANAGVAPNGTTTADLLYPSSATANASLYRGGFASISKTHSYAAKAAGKNFFCILKEGTVGGAAWFNLATGQIGTVDAAYTASMVSLGDGWYRCSVTSLSGFSQYTAVSAVDADNSVTPTVNGTDGVLIWGADLRPANIGANVPAYQRIADANTYDTSGFPLYLRFDGIDDSMYTPANLDLSGTDKVAVFAGVRRNATVTQFPVEFSSSDSNNGSFGIGADSGGAEYFFNSRGTTLRQIVVDNAAYNAPVSNVATLSADIAAPSMIARLNGTQVGSNTGSQGTGNFGTYPLYIGSRNNSTFFLNGHLYSLIIAGSAVSAGNISATEQWVAGKTGISIFNDGPSITLNFDGQTYQVWEI